MAYRRSSRTSRRTGGRSTGTRASRAYSRGGGRRSIGSGRSGGVMRLVIEHVAASPVSRNAQVLAKINPPPKQSKF